MVNVEIPLPIQIVIDDVGWWCGKNGSAYQEPYRTGIARDHVPADYKAIISLGRQLNMKPQAAFILCEWDKHNILRDLPTSTWMGTAWDNSKWVGEWQEAAADIIRSGRDHLELTLHGIGHEYWEAGSDGEWKFTRAEWHNSAGQMRPKDQVLARLDYFQRLLDQHQLGDFPTSFVPCAFLHRFEKNEAGLASLLKTAGISFISTPYSNMFGKELTDEELFGFDDGVLTVDRGQDLLNWHIIGAPPGGKLDGAICGMHWPNILHENAERNEEIVQAWVLYLKEYDRRIDRILARDTAAFATQLLYKTYTTFKLQHNSLVFDLSKIRVLSSPFATGSFVIKISSPAPLQFTSHEFAINIESTLETSEGVLYALRLQPNTHTDNARLDWSTRSGPSHVNVQPR